MANGSWSADTPGSLGKGGKGGDLHEGVGSGVEHSKLFSGAREGSCSIGVCIEEHERNEKHTNSGDALPLPPYHDVFSTHS